MVAIIRDIKTFEAVLSVDVLSYDLPVDSVGTADGSVTVYGELPHSLAGDWITILGMIYLISTVSPTAGETALKVCLPIAAFGRPILYRGPYATVGAALADGIASGFTDCPDEEYRLPYLTVSNLDTTEFIQPILSTGGLWTVSDYARQVRQAFGVELSISYDDDGMTALIASRAPEDHKSVTNDGHTQLISADYGQKAMVKVSVWQGEREHVYYRQTDGSVAAAPPVPRLDGSWGSAVADEDDDEAAVLAIAAEELNRNKAAYKIAFWSDRAYKVYDRVAMRIYGDVVNTVITNITVSSSDKRTRYIAGEMPTSLSDKLRKNSEELAKKAAQADPTPITIDKITRTQSLNWLDLWRYLSNAQGGGAWHTCREWKYTYGVGDYSAVLGQGPPHSGHYTVMVPLTGLRCEGSADSLQLSLAVSAPSGNLSDQFGWAVTTVRHDADYQGTGDLTSADMIGHGRYTLKHTKGIIWLSLSLPCTISPGNDLYVYLFGTSTRMNDHHIYKTIKASLVDTIERTAPNG